MIEKYNLNFNIAIYIFFISIKFLLNTATTNNNNITYIPLKLQNNNLNNSTNFYSIDLNLGSTFYKTTFAIDTTSLDYNFINCNGIFNSKSMYKPTGN